MTTNKIEYFIRCSSSNHGDLEEKNDFREEPVLVTRAGHHQTANRRQGIATLEFALAFPVLLLLVFYLIEFSRAMMVISVLNNTAWAGCRQAIMSNATPESVQDLVDGILKDQGVNGYSTTFLVNNQPASITSAIKNDLMTVRISVPISKVSWIPGLNFFSGNLQGQYTLPRE